MTLTYGRFLTLEGGEGSGKSTQLRLLAQTLRAAGYEIVATREPGGSPGAERIREALLGANLESFGPDAEAVAFAAARADHVETTIRPALQAGAWVVCDRFWDSTRVYQGALGQVDGAFLRALERIVAPGLAPDLTLILDLPPEIGLERAAVRAQGRAADRFERKGLAFHRAIRDAFLDLAKAEPRRCAVIDATRTPDAVADEIRALVSRRFDLALGPPRAAGGGADMDRAFQPDESGLGGEGSCPPTCEPGGEIRA